MVSDHAPDNTCILQTPLGPQPAGERLQPAEQICREVPAHLECVQLMEAASLGGKAAERVSMCPPSIPGRKGQDNFLGKLLECTIQV